MKRYNANGNMVLGIAALTGFGGAGLLASLSLIYGEWITFDFSKINALVGMLLVIPCVLLLIYIVWYQKTLGSGKRNLSELYGLLGLIAALLIIGEAGCFIVGGVYLEVIQDGFPCLIIAMICNAAGVLTAYLGCKPV